MILISLYSLKFLPNNHCILYNVCSHIFFVYFLKISFCISGTPEEKPYFQVGDLEICFILVIYKHVVSPFFSPLNEVLNSMTRFQLFLGIMPMLQDCKRESSCYFCNSCM